MTFCNTWAHYRLDFVQAQINDLLTFLEKKFRDKFVEKIFICIRLSAVVEGTKHTEYDNEQ